MEVFLWQSGLSLATKQDQQHSGRFQIGLLKWMAIGNLIQFVSFSKSSWELLLSKNMATQFSGPFWDLPLRTLLHLGRLPRFMSIILLSLQKIEKCLETYFQKIGVDWGTEDAFIAAAVQLCHSRPHPNRFPLILAPIASFLEVIGLIIWV